MTVALVILAIVLFKDATAAFYVERNFQKFVRKSLV